jgi:hypothetical protein
MTKITRFLKKKMQLFNKRTYYNIVMNNWIANSAVKMFAKTEKNN